MKRPCQLWISAGIGAAADPSIDGCYYISLLHKSVR